jgi:hypothetical protein
MIASFDLLFVLLPLVYLLASKPFLSAQTLGLKNSQKEGKYFTLAIAQLVIILFYTEIHNLHRYAVSMIPLYWVQGRFWSRSQVIGIALLTLSVMLLSIGTILFATWRPYI